VIAAGPALLAGRSRLSYLRIMLKPAPQGSFAETATTARRPVSGVAFAIIVAGAVLAAAILLAATGLWFHYGTAVFFEMIATGLAACF
jgi:hypothetical protein